MNAGDLETVKKLAHEVDEQLRALGGVGAVRELEVRRFRCELDEDEEGARAVLAEVELLRACHEAASEFLDTFQRAIERGNLTLALSTHAAIADLVKRAPVTVEFEEEEEEPHEPEK